MSHMTITDISHSQDGIILLAKKPNLTSFASLNSIKKALGTSKVGHTGTLDSFAQGLLVVCTGRLTRLAGNITAFDKTYKAVIKFGEETDTLEYTGKIIKTAPLPTIAALENALPSFTGNIMQSPPAFSAIHVDGHRASSLARGGNAPELPPRPVTVYSANILDIKADSDGSQPAAPTKDSKIKYALIEFSVSKGTYIRSLARDLGKATGSAAHLVGLYRTKVGDFYVENAAGYSSLKDFTIDNVIEDIKPNLKLLAEGKSIEVRPHFDKNNIPQEELDLQEEIRNKKVSVDKKTAALCGFGNIELASEEAGEDFRNGKPLRSYMFTTNLHSLANSSTTAVFTAPPESAFTGLIEKNETGRVSYKFVIN